MIDVEGLVFEYPGRMALNHVGFSAAAGSVTALVGPNGAGKTTLLRCLAALETPDAGQILIDGIDSLESPRQIHARIGYLPDNFGVYPELSAHRCLQYAGRAHGLGETETTARIATVAHDVGLEDRLQQRAGSLSRGQRQRLAIAQSLIHRPRVLLLDEPASGLDPGARSELAALLKQLAAQGMTIMVSSHILAELESYCTAMLALQDGRVVEHRQLGGRGNTVWHRLQLRLVDAKDGEAAAGFLATRPEVSHISAEAGMLRFAVAGGELAEAAVLKALIEAGFKPYTFGPEDTDRLQNVYLAAIDSATRDRFSGDTER